MVFTSKSTHFLRLLAPHVSPVLIVLRRFLFISRHWIRQFHNRFQIFDSFRYIHFQDSDYFSLFKEFQTQGLLFLLLFLLLSQTPFWQSSFFHSFSFIYCEVIHTNRNRNSVTATDMRDVMQSLFSVLAPHLYLNHPHVYSRISGNICCGRTTPSLYPPRSHS